MKNYQIGNRLVQSYLLTDATLNPLNSFIHWSFMTTKKKKDRREENEKRVISISAFVKVTEIKSRNSLSNLEQQFILE